MESMIQLIPVTEYQSIDQTKTVTIDQKSCNIGKYCLIQDLTRSEKASESYVNNKAEFYKRVQKALKIKTKPAGREIDILFNRDPALFRSIILATEPPASLKWQVWQLLLNDKAFYTVSEKHFGTLIQAKNDKVEDIVKKDVHRTFNEKVFFATEVQNVKVGKEMLYKICKAVGVYFKNIGYTQGFNFLAGYILEISGGQELESLNFLLQFLKNERFMFIGMFDDNFPLVYFLNYLTHKKLAEMDKEVEEALQESGIPDEVWLHKWYMSLYTGYFPSYFCSRIFDIVLSTDIFMSVSFTVALLRTVRKEIIRFREDMPTQCTMLNELCSTTSFTSKINSIVMEATKHRLSPQFILQGINDFRNIKPDVYPKFERYGNVFKHYLNTIAGTVINQNELNITVFDFEEHSRLMKEQVHPEISPIPSPAINAHLSNSIKPIPNSALDPVQQIPIQSPSQSQTQNFARKQAPALVESIQLNPSNANPSNANPWQASQASQSSHQNHNQSKPNFAQNPLQNSLQNPNQNRPVTPIDVHVSKKSSNSFDGQLIKDFDDIDDIGEEIEEGIDKPRQTPNIGIGIRQNVFKRQVG